MYPDIMNPVALSLESISSFIKEKQSRKLELLSTARHQIANLYSTYLDDIRVKLEARQRAILEQPIDKIVVLSSDTISDIHYKTQSIVMNDDDDDDGGKSTNANMCKEASILYHYENTMYNQLDILKINYNNLVIFLNDDNDAYLDVEKILSTQNFSTQSISLKHKGKRDDYENETDFYEKLNTVFVLSSLYQEPYDFNTFDIKHLKLLRQIVNSDYKFTLFNRRYEMSIPVLNDWSREDAISINIDRANFNWIFECPKYPGVMQNKDSEYNDEGGYHNTFTFESTCILIWRETK
jgi:hypothetical protein